MSTAINESEQNKGRITEFEPISEKQIEYAKELVSGNHPLYDTPPWKVLPILCFPQRICAKKRADKEQEDLLKANLLPMKR
jgi:hypothetical protein